MNNIKHIHGSIFTTKCQTIVNTVNCVGVMGAGIALEFKYRYPLMYEQYVKLCKDRAIQIGKLWIYNIPGQNAKVLNFPTKNDWKYPSKYEYLESGLRKFVETYKEKGITSIAFPLLGASNGGLDPDKVTNLMHFYLENCDIPVEIYEFNPYASDDLLGLVRNSFHEFNINNLEIEAGLKKNILLKIKEILDSGNIYTLMQLDKVKGIGKETVAACFKFAMNLKMKKNIMPKDLFGIDAKEKESKVRVNKPTVKKKKEKLSVSERSELTGLDEHTILKIDNKEEIDINIIITYCDKRKLNFKKFVQENYISLK
ncbi:macro domain-containing protein [Bacteroides sp. K03]|uniref:macro domain-containing protein n=1 Tax=Bacteroides sp. K03 TaxID=2718928 RepID=UPI001C8C219B|nr:macro domain-containing protein [Bacteroides sp. K03]MBX9188588.1 macro domain-containing protein [Bacteroides sp. K03]